MKYIDADKLIAEIKRQKHELELSIQSQGDYGQSCHIVAYDNILSLIDSIQQEQPEEKLKEEMIINEFRVIRDKCFNEGIMGWQREKLIALHFYLLGLNARK